MIRENNNGFVLPMVMIVSTLIFFILSHQISLYVTDMKFYKEKFETYKIDRLLQKGVRDVESALHNTYIASTQFFYEEGRANIQITAISPTQKNIRLTVVTNNNRSSTVILYYNPVDQKIYRWVEGR